jgi:hypothetical protein
VVCASQECAGFPYNQVIHNFDWSNQESEEVVEFHLLYSGLLKSGADAGEKLAIRRDLHSQLKELWAAQRNLRELAADKGLYAVLGAAGNADSCKDPVIFKRAFDAGVSLLADNFGTFGFRWVPLITADLCLRCSIDILLLRREKPNSVFMKGDIDARLNTLFDAFRMPDQKQELPPGAEPGEGENPFFVLLQNDDLVSEVRLVTNHLLVVPEAHKFDSNYVNAVITVKLQTTTSVDHGWAYL